ncbi:uncharacterized protein V6R79_007715 [Siganus canaliculatus]
MAWVRVEWLLVVLTGTLLPDPVHGWTKVDETELRDFYQSGLWSEPQSAKHLAPVDISDYDDEDEDDIPVALPPEFEGTATSDGFDLFTGHGFQVEFVDVLPKSWNSGKSQTSAEPNVVCIDGSFQITLSKGPLSEVKVLGSNSQAVLHAPAYCGYKLNSTNNVLTIPFTGCNVEHEGYCPTDSYSLRMVYVDEFGETRALNKFCEQRKGTFGPGQFARSTGKRKCPRRTTPAPPTITPSTSSPPKWPSVPPPQTTPPQTPPQSTPPQTPPKGTPPQTPPKGTPPQTPPKGTPPQTPPKGTPPQTPTQSPWPQYCVVAPENRVDCGGTGMSLSDCESWGCCADYSTSSCYYPLDECTRDQHFVFIIRYNSATIPVDPTKLVIPGHPSCKPVIVNDKFAIFKIKLTECGARAYEVGYTKIYMIEVQTIVQALNLKYGVITRTDPLRFMVECRYSKMGNIQQSLASIGYMVKTPSSTLPSKVISVGLYGVQLRIATDNTYTSYYPTTHVPLRLLLGVPLYFELRLRSPKPDAVLLVNYCIAYPRSAKNALVLIYEGCANPYDPSIGILYVSDLPQNRHTRRFVVKTFQFMDYKTSKYLDEEIYFMCSTEVCRTTVKTCEERCFDGKPPKPCA